jgi:rhodanese-related sulfurtransferase
VVAPLQLKSVDAAEAAKLMRRGYVLLDVRPDNVFAEVGYPGVYRGAAPSSECGGNWMLIRQLHASPILQPAALLVETYPTAFPPS